MTTTLTRTFSILLLSSSPVFAAATAPACAALCGEWKLDTDASDSRQQVLDTAFEKFKDPKPRHKPEPLPSDDVRVIGAAIDEESLGPTLNRMPRDDLRKELQQMMRQPAMLRFEASGKDIRIATESGPADRVTPGGHHTRVDRYGTARISTSWKKSRLVVVEKYDGRNQQETTVSVREPEAMLEMVQVITRTGLPRVSFRSVYRKATAPALESAP